MSVLCEAIMSPAEPGLISLHENDLLLQNAPTSMLQHYLCLTQIIF